MTAPFFTAKFLLSLPADNDEAFIVLADEFRRFGHAPSGPRSGQDLIEIAAIMRAFFAHRQINIDLPSGIAFDYALARVWFDGLSSQATSRINARFAAARENHYANLFSKVQMYEFSDDDHKKLQALINELRTLISGTDIIDDDHKRRLLKRLEAMQSELHKTVSDIDRFWAFIGEAGIQARIFGENMKPICERIGELAKIVLAVVAAKEGIKSIAAPDMNNFMLLPPAETAKPPRPETLS